MSFSTDSTSTNPAKLRMEVKSGKVQYYDRDSGSNIQVPEPFEFIVLDQLGTVRGWSDDDGSGYWANEVKNSAQEQFTVRTNKGVKETGLWKKLRVTILLLVLSSTQSYT